MLIKVTPSDLEEVVSYLEKEKVRNLLFLADLEIYGLGQEFQTVWYKKNKDHIQLVLLKYYQNFILYSENQNYNISELLEILSSFPLAALSMSYNDYLYLKPHLKKMDAEICKMTRLDQQIEGVCIDEVKRAVPSDAESIASSFIQIEEFARYRNDSFDDFVKRKERGIQDDFNRHYFITCNGIVVAGANTSCMSKNAGMIGGVFTLPSVRGKGYAKRVVTALCNDLLGEGKTPCLFYINPIAGKMYHELGFKDFDQWVVLTPSR